MPTTRPGASTLDGRSRDACRPRLQLFLPLFLIATSSGCCWSGLPAPPDDVVWMDLTPPRSSLAEKAARYQARLESYFQTPEGLVRYSRVLDEPDDGTYGDLSDVCFHTGIYLASQALRFATTGEPAAREQVLLALDGLRLLMDVTGVRGLLARHASPEGAMTERNPKWRRSSTRPGYAWRTDVSKDQYAGFIDGLGVTLAVVHDTEIRFRVAELACAAADHLIENNMSIRDFDGDETTYGNLAGTIWCVPIGVNSLISLAIARVAAMSSGALRYRVFHEKLLDEGYARTSYWAHPPLFDSGRRVNDHMAYLGFYPLLLLEERAEVLADLVAGEGRSWKAVGEEHNAFFALVHATACERSPASGDRAERPGVAKLAREALREFPEDKVEWPVDLTRAGFDFPRSILSTKNCEPLSTQAVPLYLRVRSSSMWVSNPYRLAGDFGRRGKHETAGGDYLVAYWMARYHGVIAEED